jgi:hypothetical protein
MKTRQLHSGCNLVLLIHRFKHKSKHQIYWQKNTEAHVISHNVTVKTQPCYVPKVCQVNWTLQ